MIKTIATLLFIFIFPVQTFATPSVREAGGVIYVNETSVKELEDIFTQYGYTRFHILDNDNYPAIFVKKLPSDFRDISSLKYRNELFIRILTPLALKINEEISNERETLFRLERSFLKNQQLNEAETKKLEELAIKYDVFTREKNTSRIKIQFEKLKQRINIIPPSIFIAVAAIESNWGFSRVANEANSLYKEKIWFTNEGLEPLENKEDGYRFKIFNSLIDSMRSFALTFNSNINYENAWQARDEMIKRHQYIIGESIAYALSISSTLPNYAGIVDYTTAFYNLVSLDIGKLKRIKK